MRVFSARTKAFLTIGAIVAASAVTATSGASAAPAGPSRVGSTPLLPVGASVIGVLPADTALQATVMLKSRDAAGLEAYASAVATPGNALYRQYITTAQFAARFGPSTAQVSAVHDVLAADGLNPAPASANHLAIVITGTTGQFSKAFNTSFTRVRLSTGRIAHTNTSAPLIAASIAPTVLGVIGLDDLVLPHRNGITATKTAPTTSPHTLSPHVVTGGPQPCTAAINDGADNSSYTADQLASAYGLSSVYGAGDFGAGQTIAMYELEPNLTSDIAAYQACYGTSASISYKQVDGGAGTGAGEGEASLDIENAISIAPEASQIVYQGANTGSGPIDTFNKIITDNIAKVISTSWGLCENNADSTNVAAENTLFQEAATQGQSLLDASGDLGSEDCGDDNLSADDPGGQPFVTVVGGTTLTALGPPPTETVWNESVDGNGAGGGGISEFFAMPSYQTGAAASVHVINANSSGTPCGAASGRYCREEPDVALDADPETGFVVYQAGAWTATGGTSGAAPIWAAFIALANASSGCGGTNIGFANPALYTIAGSAYASNFHDITSGNNDYTGTNGGLYPSGVGYDMASGLGTPNGGTLSASLCAQALRPAITSVSPTFGPPAGGTTVTITGKNFTAATSVKFGTVAATSFSVVSSTKITAVSPAQAAAVHNISVTTPNGTSATVAADTFTYKVVPVVTAISPTAGPVAGDTTVTITGSGFTGATFVYFGNVGRGGFTVVSDSKITVLSPAQPAGTHNVYVTTPGGTSAAVTADRFTYLVVPAVTAISPAAGPVAGGTTVTITGSGFTGTTSVKFGTVAATSFSVVSDSKLTAVSPAQPAAAHNVYVTTPGGTSAAVTADRFTYQ